MNHGESCVRAEGVGSDGKNCAVGSTEPGYLMNNDLMMYYLCTCTCTCTIENMEIWNLTAVEPFLKHLVNSFNSLIILLKTRNFWR